MRVLITFSYDGSYFKGYATQKHQNTIQDKIENSLFKISNKHIKIHASGRTDTNVHALNQTAHFDIDMNITLDSLKKALNGYLKPHIYIKKIKKVNTDFHARFNVLKKEYHYIINLGEYNPLLVNYEYQLNKEIDIEKIKKATKYLIGTHNFKSFTTNDNIQASYIRTIYDIKIKHSKNKLMITFVGDGFMRYQIRNMVGTLIEVGLLKKEPEDIKKIIKSENRIYAGKNILGNGLYLVRVYYK